MTGAGRQIAGMLETQAGMHDGLDRMAATLREMNRDMAAFLARRRQSHSDGPVA